MSCSQQHGAADTQAVAPALCDAGSSGTAAQHQQSSSPSCAPFSLRSSPVANLTRQQAAAGAAAAQPAVSCGSSDTSAASASSDFDDYTMSDAESMDPGLSAHITGLQQRFARRSAEVQALKVALAAAERASQGGAALPAQQASIGGLFNWQPNGQLACTGAPDVSTPLFQATAPDSNASEQCDDSWLRTRSLPDAESQLLAELAQCKGVPARCF